MAFPFRRRNAAAGEEVFTQFPIRVLVREVRVVFLSPSERSTGHFMSVVACPGLLFEIRCKIILEEMEDLRFVSRKMVVEIPVQPYVRLTK